MNRTAVAVIALMALMAPATFAQTAGSLSRPGAPVDAKTAPQSFSALSKRLMPAVVNISTSQVVASRLPSFPEGSPAERFNEYFGRNDDGWLACRAVQ